MTLPGLSDLFHRHRAKATGVWKLGQDPNRVVFLDSGDVVFAQSTHPQDRLTALLVERGLMTQAQLDYAMANLKPGLSVGKNLIDMGFITQRVLLEVARLQVERVVWGAMATPETVPAFEARELEGNVVRLPFETPLLLLNGLLNLQDREQVLELLGPLNQVVLLEGKRLTELSLPVDLARLPPLLDGSRTLLELAREGGVEPLRLGAFALFLREMGWARLYELPPLDRTALDQALTPEPEPPSAPFPEPTGELAPSLFASIEAAAKPTTNLDHLSEALDSLPELPEAQEIPQTTQPFPVAPIPLETVEAEEGQAELPTPVEVPPPAEPEHAPEEPAIRISSLDEESRPAEVPDPMVPEPPRRGRGLLWVLLVLILLGAAAGWWAWQQRRPRVPPLLPAASDPAPVPAPPPPAPAASTPPSPAASTVTPIPAPEPTPEPPAPKAVPKETPKEGPKDGTDPRLRAIRPGELGGATALSPARARKEGRASQVGRQRGAVSHARGRYRPGALPPGCIDGTSADGVGVARQ